MKYSERFVCIDFQQSQNLLNRSNLLRDFREVTVRNVFVTFLTATLIFRRNKTKHKFPKHDETTIYCK